MPIVVRYQNRRFLTFLILSIMIIMNKVNEYWAKKNSNKAFILCFEQKYYFCQKVLIFCNKNVEKNPGTKSYIF